MQHSYTITIRKFLVVVLAAAAFSGAMTSSSRAGDLAGACSPNAIRYKTVDVGQGVTSTTPITAPGMIVNFNTASSSSCIIILFSALAAAETNETMLVRALLDGSPCESQAVNFRLAGSYESRAANFVCAAVGPGMHSARIQFWSSNGAQVFLARRTMILQYVK